MPAIDHIHNHPLGLSWYWRKHATPVAEESWSPHGDLGRAYEAAALAERGHGNLAQIRDLYLGVPVSER